MEERLRLVVWTFAGAGSLALLGGLFGALAGSLAWRSGRAAGGFLGRTFLQFLTEQTGRAFSPTARAALVGAADGAAFLAVVGGLAGYFAGDSGTVRPAVALGVLGGALLLTGSAAGVGCLAYGLVRVGVWSIGTFFGGAAVGALGGARLAGVDGIMAGTLAGALAGAAVALLSHRGPPGEGRGRHADDETLTLP